MIEDAAGSLDVTRCLIVDHHPLMRDGLTRLVATQWPDAVIHTAGTLDDARQEMLAQPELCLLEPSMAGADAGMCVAGLHSMSPRTRILVISAIEDDDMMLELAASAAAGFVSKQAPATVLAAAITTVMAGWRYFPYQLAAAARAGGKRHDDHPLTERQTSVLRLIALGRSNKEIAKEIGLSPATVKTHVAHAMAVFGAANRAEAVSLAAAAGLI